jgi:ribonucleoside-triphosphate reductase
MVENKIKEVIKRDGSTVPFDQERITQAIFKAITSVNQGDGEKAKEISDKVVALLNRRFKNGNIPTVEQIQDIIEEVLILEGLVETAKSFILYREQRRKIREAVLASEEAVDRIDQYLEKLDWEVQENANMTFSLQGLNHYGVSYIVKKYWLNKIYPKEIREANESGDFHLHNLDTLGPYTFFGKEVVIAKLNGDIKLLSLENLYEEISEPEILLNEKDEAFAKYPKNLFVLDRNGWTKVSRMVRKRKDREMRFIKSEQGQSVIVTDNHPFIVKEKPETSEKEIEAKEVQVKNHLILSCHIPSLLPSEKLFFKEYIYLAEELLKRNYKNFFLEGFDWKDFIENWKGSLRVEGTISTSNSANSLDNKLKLTEDLGYLVGFFITEGNYDSWRLNITTSEKEIIGKIQKICARLGVRAYVKEKEGETKDISINSSTLKLVFEKVFQIKPLSRNKNLPFDILTYNLDFIKGLIAGIIDGDGSIGTERTQIIIRVSSRTMLEQLAILLQFLGIVPRTGVNTKDIGKKRYFRGKEIVQNYPLYRLTFSKKENVNFPSLKYQKAKPAKTHWRSEEYGWNRVLNNEITTIPEKFIYDITTESNTFLCNSLLVHNCVGWDLYDLLVKGFGGVSGKIESRPAKHFHTALMQVVNFLYTLQGEAAGAVSFSNVDTLLAPFIRYDNLNYQQVKQALQEFLFNMAIPTRVGFQTPFSNITLDLKHSPAFAKLPVIIGGKPQDKTYSEFEEEMKIFDKAIYEVYMEGDAKGRPFHFPIPTINITKDFPWQESAFDGVFEASAKYGTNYFANYINSEMKPEDVRSMCPLAGKEKVLIKSSRGRGLEYSSIKNIAKGHSKQNEYWVFSDGKFVKGKFRVFKNQKMIKVILVNNHEIEMSEEHLNFVLENINSKEVKVLKGKELKKEMYLPYSLNIYEGNGGNRELGFFVGAYAGDGSLDGDVAVIFSLNKDQKQKLGTKLQQIAEKYFGAHCNSYLDPSQKTLFLRVNSKAAVGLCKEFVVGKGTNKFYTPRVFEMSKEFRLGIIEGHLATDGGGRNRIYTSSPKMVETLNMLAATLGTTTALYEDNRPNRFGKKPNYAVLIYKLNRKKLKGVWFKKFGKLWVKIKEIKKLPYKADAYCFEVENDVPMFTVGTTGILTHNCRLRLDLTQLQNRGGGGLFGSGAKTGSIGVVTINLPRIGYLSKTKKEFFERLARMMDLAKESLEIKRKVVENFIEKGLYPYSRYYLQDIKQMRGKYWANHFSTIGLVGMNEALLNFIGENIASEKGRKFALEVLDFMRDRLVKYQEETGNIYNLEQTPSESTAYRLALKDKERYPDIITAGTQKTPYYTNSTQLPVNYTDDIFEALELQDELTCKYTGGSVFHVFLGERMQDGQGVKILVKKIFENFKLPYITITPTFSICPVHGYLPGEHFYCPKCTVEQPCEVYTRVVGYYRPVNQFNLGKQQEYKERKEFKIKASLLK